MKKIGFLVRVFKLVITFIVKFIQTEPAYIPTTVIRVDGSPSSPHHPSSMPSLPSSGETCKAPLVPEVDPNMKAIKYEKGGDDNVYFYMYTEPHVKTMYNESLIRIRERERSGVTYYGPDPPPPPRVKKVPSFRGRNIKLFNLDPREMSLYFDSDEIDDPSFVRTIGPMSSHVITAFVGSALMFKTSYNLFGDKVFREETVAIFNITEEINLYVHDAVYVPGRPDITTGNLQNLLPDQDMQEAYRKFRMTIDYDEVYSNITGRSYLSNFNRQLPKHFMWRADYFGQEHTVFSRETHFRTLPSLWDPEARTYLMPIPKYHHRVYKSSDEERELHQFRDTSIAHLEMKLKVISCAPRVFEIRNFLSEAEVMHMTELAKIKNLELGGTGGKPADAISDLGIIKYFRHAKIVREESPVVDAIYRRAADLMHIPEHLLRERWNDETQAVEPTAGEPLQMIKYETGGYYLEHCDFRVPEILSREQPTRFATLIFYLNEGMQGGETKFSRWVNADTNGALRVKPEKGKAVLFYSMLPDGNLDDLSHHGSMTVKKGEKLMANLFVWDPFMG